MTIHTKMLTAGSNIAMFVFGIVMAMLGAVLPLLAERIHFDLAQAGNLFLCMNCAMLLSMLSSGLIMDHFGKKPVLVGGSILVASALWLVEGCESYRSLLAMVFVLGFGGGALNGAANTLVADLNEDPRKKGSALNLLGVYFGFGALFLPFIIGSLVKAVGHSPIFYLAVALSLIPGIVFVLQEFPPPKAPQGLPIGEAAQLVRNPLVLLLGFLLFFESGNEFIMGGYTSAFMKDVLGESISSASYVLAAYWAAMMVGRIVSSRFLLTRSSSSLILISAVGSAAGGLLLAVTSSVPIAVLAAVIIGASFAGIFPTTLGVAGSRFEAYSGTVLGILFGIGLVGGMSLPWAAGHLSERYGLRVGLSLVVVNALMIGILQLIIRNRTREHS